MYSILLLLQQTCNWSCGGPAELVAGVDAGKLASSMCGASDVLGAQSSRNGSPVRKTLALGTYDPACCSRKGTCFTGAG